MSGMPMIAETVMRLFTTKFNTCLTFCSTLLSLRYFLLFLPSFFPADNFDHQSEETEGMQGRGGRGDIARLCSHWSSSYITVLSLVESFIVMLRQLSYAL